MVALTLNLHDDIQPVSDFRAKAAEVIKRVRETGRPVILTQNGRSAAVLLDVDAYQALVDENALLHDLRAGLDDVQRGRVTDNDKAKKALLARYQQAKK